MIANGAFPRRWPAVLVLVLAASARTIGVQDRGAVVVEEIVADSIAAKTGFAVGDRIVEYDARAVDSPFAFQAAEENTFKPQVTITLVRDNARAAIVVAGGRLGLQVRPDMPPAVLAAYDDGRAARDGKRVDDAVRRWTDAARASHDANDLVTEAWLHGRIGDLHESQRRWKDAVASHLAAWEIVQRGSDAAAQSRVLTALGRSTRAASDWPAAQQWYERASAIDHAAGRERWVAVGEMGRGNVAYDRGILATARESYLRALAIFERHWPGSREVALTLNNLGNTEQNAGDLPAAQAYLTRSLEILEKLLPESLEVALALNNLGLTTSERGDLDAALEYHRRSIRIKERVAPDSLSMAASFNNLGIVLRALGDTAAAFDYHTRALRIRERLAPDSLDLATTFNNLGNIYKVRGDLDASEDHHRRALAIRERLAPDSNNVAMSLTNLGESARARGDLAAARDFNLRALAIKEKRSPDTLNVAVNLAILGSLARENGDLGAALDYHSRALAIRERDAPESLVVAASLNLLGSIALADRRYADARALLSRAVSIVEAHRWQVRFAEARALLVAEYTAAYIGLRRAHAALGDIPAAFASAESVRARSLLDGLSENAAKIESAVDPALLARERALQLAINEKANRQQRVLASRSKDQAAAAKADLDASLVQYRELQSQIREADAQYAALTQPQPVGLAEVQRDLLDGNTVLLEYALADEGSHLFAITPTTSRVIDLPKRAEVDAAARRVYELLTARQPVSGETPAARRARIEQADAAYAEAAAALSRMVLAPVTDQIAGRRLLVVADGALQYVPFAALPDPATMTQPLIVGHEIVSLPSASVLTVLREPSRKRRAADRLVAVVADPVFETGDPRLQRRMTAVPASPSNALPASVADAIRAAGIADDRGVIARLPFTRDEAQAILSLAPPGQATQAVDFNASRQTVTGADLGRYRVVHLATHGVLHSEHPELSGLVLSLVDEHGVAQDGFIRLHEIYNLDWSAELVVLSACQTGLGKEIRGEGLVGLTRGFMHAGSPRVMASLWNVNDRVTAQLMTRFYDGLFAKKLSPAAALRAAQVEMWNQQPWRAPYYWAAFVLQGDWR